MKKITLLFMMALMAIAADAQLQVKRMATPRAKAKTAKVMKASAMPYVFDFNTMEVATSSKDSNEGDITEPTTLTEGIVSMTISASTTNTPNRFWSTNNGPQLRVYGGTLTFNVPEGHKLSSVVFMHNGNWGGKNNAANVTASTGTMANDAEENAAGWVGQAQEVVFSIGGNTQLNQIICVVDGEAVNPDPVDPTEGLVVLPDGVVAEDYTLATKGYEAGEEDWETLNREETVQVAFNGNEVYLGGLSYYFADAFVKGTIQNGKVIVKSGQFMGEDEYGKIYLVGMTFEANGDDTISDIVFSYDAIARTITMDEEYLIGESEDPTEMEFYAYSEAVTFTPGAYTLPDVVTVPEGLKTEGWYFSAINSDEEKVVAEVNVGFDNDTVYIQGLCDYLPEAWVKGTIDGTTATFAGGQYYGQYHGEYDLFFGAYSKDGVVDAIFEYDEAAGTFTTQDYIVLNGSASAIKLYDYFSDVIISREKPEVPEPIVAPENLQTAEYALTATEMVSSEDYDDYDDYGYYDDYSDYEEEAEDVEIEEPYSSNVLIGFDGQDVYIQGLCDYMPEAWVKGTLSEDGKKIVVPANQFIGTYSTLFGNYDLYFTAGDTLSYELLDAVFDYDAENGKLSSSQDLFINSSGSMLYYYRHFKNMVMTKLEETAATPADPTVSYFEYLDYEGIAFGVVEFDIPTESTEGTPLLTSKLFFQVMIEDANGQVAPLKFTTDLYEDLSTDMDIFPYNFRAGYEISNSAVYLNQPKEEILSWKKVGVKSIYYGSGETHESNIGWYDVENWYSDGIKDIATEGTAVYTDLQGRKVPASQKGLLIKQVRTSNGNITTVKTVRR